MSQDPDVASAVAAIRSLLEFLKRDQSKTTVQHPLIYTQLFVVEMKKILSCRAIDFLNIHLLFLIDIIVYCPAKTKSPFGFK